MLRPLTPNQKVFDALKLLLEFGGDKSLEGFDPVKDKPDKEDPEYKKLDEEYKNKSKILSNVRAYRLIAPSDTEYPYCVFRIAGLEGFSSSLKVATSQMVFRCEIAIINRSADFTDTTHAIMSAMISISERLLNMEEYTDPKSGMSVREITFLVRAP